MASPPLKYLEITINYDGVFDRPIDYTDGLSKTERIAIEDIDFNAFNHWHKELTGIKTFSVYYVVPGKEMYGGLRMLKCNEDLEVFVKHGFKNTEKMSIYIDIYEDDLTDFLGEDRVGGDDKEKYKVAADDANNTIVGEESDESLDLEEEDVDLSFKVKET